MAECHLVFCFKPAPIQSKYKKQHQQQKQHFYINREKK